MQLGSIMGPGQHGGHGRDNCMVMWRATSSSLPIRNRAAKCIPCRVGLDQSLRILNAFTRGQAVEADLDHLDEMGRMIATTSLCGLGQTAPNPLLTTMRHFRHDSRTTSAPTGCRAGVCENWRSRPARTVAPLHMNIPRFLQLYKEDRLEEAFEAVVLDNPLPASTGPVCQHPCEDRCRRRTIDESVNHARSAPVHSPTLSINPTASTRLWTEFGPKTAPTDRKVAVVGGGPSGLSRGRSTCAAGHEVTMYIPTPSPAGCCAMPSDTGCRERWCAARWI